MLHCNIPANVAEPSSPTAPGIFSAKTLQTVLGVPQLTARQHEGALVDFASPYGRLPATSRKLRRRPNDSELRLGNGVVRRKRCRKLEPMKVSRKEVTTPPGNQANNVDRGTLDKISSDEQQLQQLRLGLKQIVSKQQKNADRLKDDIQWIHGHFPVLKLANAKCSRTLRQQLFRNAVVHVFVNATLRKAWRFWHGKVLEVQRKERLQLSASRRLIAMFERVSLDRIHVKFQRWRAWVLECHEQESLAAVLTLQQFFRFVRSRREGREDAARQAALLQALQDMSRQATKIQSAYRRHRHCVEQQRRENAARVIQHLELSRIARNEVVKRQHAATILQRSYRAYTSRRRRTRAAAIAQLLDKSRDRQARRIQSAWMDFKGWRDGFLPGEIVETLVDQIEFLYAVLSIQRHLRGFQCRFRFKREINSARRIQSCWRGACRREAARVDRKMMAMQHNLAALCIQRTFRRRQHDRKARAMMSRSTRPLYMRARHLGNSFRDRYRVQIFKSAAVVIQTAWRKHVANEREKQRRLTAAVTMQKFLRRSKILSRWRRSTIGAFQQQLRRRDTAALTLQRWMRRRHKASKSSVGAMNVFQQVSAALSIQRWYRRRHFDHWYLLLSRLMTIELPKSTSAANKLARCWRAYAARKRDHSRRASTIADLIERQRRQQLEDRAARCIQRMFRRMIDRRDGKLLLQRYKILLRGELRRRQQRAVVHKFLEEKTQQRQKKQQQLQAVTAAKSGSRASATPAAAVDGAVATSPSETLSVASGEEVDDTWLQQDAEQTPVQYWSEEYQRAYLFNPGTGESTWL